jgi:hypothetical protein
MFLAGLQAFGSVNFEGRLQVSLTTIDDDFVGFAFAFQSHSNFYVMTWKRHVFLGQPNRPPLGRAGVAIKVANFLPVVSFSTVVISINRKFNQILVPPKSYMMLFGIQTPNRAKYLFLTQNC